MNRRVFLRGLAVGVATSLAGCETLLYGKEGNVAVATANSELSEAAVILNKLELTVDGEIDISSGDFEGYSPENVTQHTKAANEALADDGSDAADVLSAISTVLEETAHQYAALDDVFGYVAGYEQLYSEGKYTNAMEASNQFAENLSEVASHSRTITDELVRLDDAGYNNPIEGFSIDQWSEEQSIFVGMIQAMNPLGIGFTRQTDGMRLLRSVSARRNHEEYQTGLGEAQEARDSFKVAHEQFGTSLDRGLKQRQTFVEQLACLSNGYVGSTETVIDALEAYNDGNDSKGDDLWEQAISEMEQVNEDCLGGE